ncbi:MAG: aspartate carbamoyltransferase, partial [Candidimonas sp.]
PVPIINAGDGHGEHPTQALLDAFTIAQRHDINVPLHVGFVGDLKYGRTVHSLINLLPRLVKNLHVHLIAPYEVQMAEDEFSIPVKKHHIKELPNIIPQLDVLYATRIQKERFSGSSDLEYCITKNMMDMAKPTLSLMHPLPRNSEIPTEIDTDPRAAYFEQMKNGMFIRMAILSWILR